MDVNRLRRDFLLNVATETQALWHRRCALEDNRTMNGIQFVTDEKGRKVAVQIDLRKHGALWEDFYDGVVSERRRREKGGPIRPVKRGWPASRARLTKGKSCEWRMYIQLYSFVIG